ncbi:hypothetical protein PoB_000788600 [Plakobranchus ocellatus]|uniref:Uncharacterized protein n=1 Tax=Plakobranchus ocellatus TaxID=259542 RepID=A0AAV3Y2E0_9GAST|nr:hypothetical protein PoB_000788600 [Plakobranchus ocellatus]
MGSGLQPSLGQWFTAFSRAAVYSLLKGSGLEPSLGQWFTAFLGTVVYSLVKGSGLDLGGFLCSRHSVPPDCLNTNADCLYTNAD